MLSPPTPDLVLRAACLCQGAKQTPGDLHKPHPGVTRRRQCCQAASGWGFRRAVTRRLDKEITGFGELFRMLSYEQIGAVAMLSRATAGVAGRRIVFSVPGSTAAVELAMTKLILPTLGHVVGLVRG